MDRKDILDDFLISEISYQDLYDGILDFVSSFNIRSGEYEGNEYIVKKMDLHNFIIFPEYIFPDGHREISPAVSMYKDELIKIMNEHAKKVGLNVKK